MLRCPRGIDTSVNEGEAEARRRLVVTRRRAAAPPGPKCKPRSFSLSSSLTLPTVSLIIEQACYATLMRPSCVILTGGVVYTRAAGPRLCGDEAVSQLEYSRGVLPATKVRRNGTVGPESDPTKCTSCYAIP